MTIPYGDPAPTPGVPGSPGPAPAPARPRASWRSTALAAVLVGLVVAVAGLAAGLLWADVSPRIGVIKVAEGFVYADAEPEQAVAADGWFAIIGLSAGVLFAVLAWVLLRRYRGIAMLSGLVLGSLVSAWLAWWIGMRVGNAHFYAVRDTVALGTRLNAPLALRLTDLDRHAFWPPKLTGVTTAQALAAAITYTLLAGFSTYPSLRGPDPQSPTTSLASLTTPQGPGAADPDAISSDPDGLEAPPR